MEYDFSDEEQKQNMSNVAYSYERQETSESWFRKKAKCWEHEKEWRVVCLGCNEELNIRVKNIYFGLNFDFANEKEYDEIIQCAKEKGIGLYRAVQSETEYKITFVPLFS